MNNNSNLVEMKRSGVTIMAEPTEVSHYKKCGFIKEGEELETAITKPAKSFSKLTKDELTKMADMLQIDVTDMKVSEIQEAIKADTKQEVIDALLLTI